MPINIDTVNTLYGLDLTSEQLQEWYAERAEPSTRSDLRGRRGLGSRPRTLRKVLSRLHPQAVGTRTIRARQVGHVPRADAHKSRRPLLHRQVPVHAETRLYAHVRADTRPSEHHVMIQTESTTSANHPPPARDLYGPDRRIFRFPVRQAALSLDRFEHVTLDQPQYQPVAVVNYPRRRLTPASPSTSTLPDRPTRKRRSPTSIRLPTGDPYYPIPKAENQELYKQYERLAWRRRSLVRRPVGDLPILQHGSDRRPGAGDLSADQRAVASRGDAPFRRCTSAMALAS